MFDKLAQVLTNYLSGDMMSRAPLNTPQRWLSLCNGTERVSGLTRVCPNMRRLIVCNSKPEARNGKLATHGVATAILARQQQEISALQVIHGTYAAKYSPSHKCETRLQRRSDLETFAMSNVPPKVTGLPMVVYISIRNAKHGCRLKVSQMYGTKMRFGQWFSMTVEDEPRIIGDTGDIEVKDIQQVREFIRLNRRVILDFWDQEDCIDPRDVMYALMKLD